MCSSDLAILEEDLATLSRLECGGFDEDGEPCAYSLSFEDDEDSFEFILDELNSYEEEE